MILSSGDPLRAVKEAPGEISDIFKEQTSQAFGAGQQNVAEGVAAMKRGDILKGATSDVIGTVQEGMSPLTGAALTAWNMLGWGDPALTGTEHIPEGLRMVQGEKVGEVRKPSETMVPPTVMSERLQTKPTAQMSDAELEAQAAQMERIKNAPPKQRPTVNDLRSSGAIARGPSSTPVPVQATREPEPVDAAAAKAVGAAPVQTSEILAGTIADNEKKLAAQPGFKENVKNLATAIRSISSPDKATPEGVRAASSIRSAIGRGTRASEQTKATFEKFQKQVNAYSTQDKLDIIDNIQNRSDRRAQGYEPIPEIKPLMDELQQTFESRRAKAEAAPSTEKMNFINDYFPQMWKDPEKARTFAVQFGTKEGSGGFTKKRTIPTMADGIRAGLEPVTTDPIEGTFRYVENFDRFLATNEVFDTAVEKGDVVWRNPSDRPAGWAEVNGRQSNKYPGQKAYAPEGWARTYNRFISRPPGGLIGQGLKGLQATANSISAFKLGFSGYHALNMVGESIRSGIANALDEAFYGNPIRAAAALGKAYVKPVTSAIRGRQMLKSYLHDVGSPEMRKVVDLATEANFRVAGKGRIADEYRFTGAGSVFDSFRKGTLKAELQSGLKSAIGIHRPVRAIKAIATGVGKTLEAFSDPLFRTYIPAIKNGAFYDIVSTWLREHPEASHEEQVAFARKASDIVDNNFGEMNQDNIFWERWTKQLAQASFVSYSYTLGTARQIAGTAGDLAKVGKEGWSNNLSQAVALPIMVGTLGAIYHYAKTGKPPQSLSDLIAPQTGGTDATTGQPERAVMPSYLQQFLNGYQDPGQEATNKLNGLYELMKGAFTGKDWRGDPIAPSTASPAEVVKAYLEMAAGTWQPISTENRAKVGSKISGPERFSGMKAAPMFLTDPQGYAVMKRKQAAKADKLKARHDAAHERNYGGTQ